MQILLLFALQTLILGAGFTLLWRRMGALRQEVGELRQALAQRQGGARAKLVAVGASASRPAIVATDPPLARAARAWRKTAAPPSETVRGFVLTFVAFAPAFGLLAGAPAIAMTGAGMVLGAVMLLAALNPSWRDAAWPGVLTASAWALAGFAFAAAPAHPIATAACAALAALGGLIEARLGRAGPGAALAAAMSLSLLALGAQSGMVGAPGFAYGAIVMGAALLGASALRLEFFHHGAFVAALAGLFVLSGQPAAAFWFTPAATWSGALFLAIAIVRAPQLGARGAAIAGAGALAPLAAIAALHAARHGLADALAAGGAFLALALALVGLIAVAAARRERGLKALGLTLWMLALGAFVALFAALALNLAPPLTALTLMAAALALLALDLTHPHAAWPGLALVSAALSLLFAGLTGALVLAETAPGWASLGLGFALPAALAAASAALARRSERDISAGLFAFASFALALAGAALALRLVFSFGAPLLAPIGAAEAAAHACVWLLGGLAIGAKAGGVRKAASAALWLAALATAVALAALWLYAYASEPLLALAAFSTPSVVALAALLAAHWSFWRTRKQDFSARVSLAGAALLAAAALSVEVLKARTAAGGADWVSGFAGAAAFTLAIAVNFAPGIVSSGPVWRAVRGAR